MYECELTFVTSKNYSLRVLKRKSLTLVLASLLLLGSTGAVNAAAPKAGSICTKLGKKETYLGKTYTCIKSGKKLVWNKGVAIKVAAPKVTPTPTASPIPTPSPEPTPTFVFPPLEPLTEKAPTGFVDLLENYSGISKVVWSEIQKLALEGSTKSSFDIEFGPKTTLQSGVGKPQDYFEKASKLWANYSQPKTTKAFFFGFADLNWVQGKNRALGGSWHKPEELADNCKNEIECGSFGGAYKGQGQLFIGVSTRERPIWNLGWVRGNLAHEFTHTVQYSELGAPAGAKLPCWFAEGQPQVAGQAIGFETLEDYRKSRLAWINQPAGVLESYSPDSILKFYEATGGSGNGKCSQSVRPRVYDIGFFTVEALSAIKGIQSTMDLVVSVGKGVSFETSFKNIYGISWNEAAPILAQTISRIYLMS